jgi:hypothetical protein
MTEPRADWACARCGWANRDFATQCLSCGALRSEPSTPPTPALTTAEPLPYLPGPAAAERWSTRGLGRGVLFVIAAAVLASVVWYAVVVVSGYELGIVAAGVGFVVGTAAVIGARGQSSLWLVGASVLFTLLALVYSTYLITYHFVTQIIGPVDLIQPPWVVVPIVIEVMAADPISLLFWAIALYFAASVPFKAIGAAPEPAERPLPATPDGQVSP